MSFPWYIGRGRGGKTSSPPILPASAADQHRDPAGYLADAGAVDAVNVAMLLGQPLLVTGEPGTGKTQLAYSVAWELNFDPPLKFETKSTSTARDLFYTYDALGRFHAAHTGEGSQNTADYITYNALGLAILYANESASVRHLVNGDLPRRKVRRSVVLIDEIDKAPRDFPNDILNEIEGLYFRIPELKNVRVDLDPELRPIVIITSNSEKHLPDAFLRRCVYYNIAFPDHERLTKIVASRLGESLAEDMEILDSALDLLMRLRDPRLGLVKKPSTGEFLAWLRVLRASGVDTDQSLHRHGENVSYGLTTLIKTADDIPRARQVVEEWAKAQT